ncbi:CPBP family intramembrane metalloprotease [Cyanobacterium stanieri LEGE 03274]|uniref:CPBP family intramembrane metalloprotease n=1 Tax=Cyanobacterium stanieri LEGE 03274 TaxID=1828756 RepID=A0ABR9V3J9_9CHRO|nr:CPBP family intramembrane glutamic endopeptidase [Cyanobacterium stanieri]MBE9222475.1 CPBP family intramembrane metalloprotease [Cyanobacterium stanieri LEGE 03274]
MSDNQENVESLSRIQILVFMGITAVIFLLIAQIWHRAGSIALIPIQFNLSAIITGALLATGILLASVVLSKCWTPYRISAEKYMNLIISPLLLPDLIWVGLLPGLSEELLFRGVMIPAFGYGYGAIVISSILFGVLHLSDAQNWHYVLWATIIGSILGYSAYATDNLLVPITAHILINFSSSLLWKLNHNRKLQ